MPYEGMRRGRLIIVLICLVLGWFAGQHERGSRLEPGLRSRGVVPPPHRPLPKAPPRESATCPDHQHGCGGAFAKQRWEAPAAAGRVRVVCALLLPSKSVAINSLENLEEP